MTRHRVVIFTAVSGKPQAEKQSLEVQLARCREVIASHPDWIEIEESPLTVPGQSREIIDLEEAMAEIPQMAVLINLVVAHKVDLIVTRDWDRLARSEPLAAFLRWFFRMNGAQVYTYSSPVEPSAPEQSHEYNLAVDAFAALKGVLGGYENYRMRAYIRDGNTRKAASGYSTASKPAFGYRRVSGQPVLEIDPAEAAIVLLIEDMLLGQGLTINGITALLNERGIKSPRGGRWHGSVVRAILGNRFYVGEVIYGRRRTHWQLDPNGHKVRHFKIHEPYAKGTGLHPPLRTEERQGAIEARLNERCTTPIGRTHGTSIWPFSGLVFCAFCHCHATGATRRDGKRFYRCMRAHTRQSSCGVLVFESELFDGLVAEFSRVAKNPEGLEMQLRESDQAQLIKLQAQAARVREELVEGTRGIARWNDAFTRGKIDIDERNEWVERLRSQQRANETELERASEAIAALTSTEGKRERLLAIAQNAEALFSDMNDPLIRKALVRECVERIVIGRHEIRNIIFGRR